MNFSMQQDGSYIEAGSMIAGCLGNGHDVLCSMGADAPIEGISVSPSSVKPGEKITIKAKIHGIGAWYIACGNFTLSFYFDDIYIGCYKDRITKGQTWWVPFEYIIPEGTSPGVHTISAKEALSGTARATAVTIEKPPPPPQGKMVITKLEYPEKFETNVPFIMYVTFRNDGADDGYFCRIYDRDIGGVIGSTTGEPPIASGESKRTRFRLVLSQQTDFHGRAEVGHFE